MDYEKKYNELVNAIKVLQEANPSDIGIRNWVNDNVPELRESEDEKTRKEIVCYLKKNLRLEWATWLEKQGKQKEYTFKSIPRLLDMIEPSDRAKTYCQKLIDTLAKEGYNTDVKIVEEVLKGWNGEDVPMAVMDGQKSASCSEKYITDVFDKVGLAKIVREQCNDNLTNALQDAMIELSKFMPQPKQEWSEEDEKFFKTALWHISYSISNGESTDIHCDTTEWLKSLKQRYTWKPSDEQMKALDSAIDEFDGYQEFDSLVSLKKDLEKLKGE